MDEQQIMQFDDENFRDGKWFKCIFCGEPPCTAIVLPCFHMVCYKASENCISALHSRETEDGHNICPLCETKFHRSQIKDLDKEIVCLLKILKAEKCCSKENIYRIYCSTCPLRLCKDCLEKHNQIEVFRNRHLINPDHIQNIHHKSEALTSFQSFVKADIAKLKSTHKIVLKNKSRFDLELQKIRHTWEDTLKNMNYIGLGLSIQSAVQAEVDAKNQEKQSKIQSLARFSKTVYPFAAFLEDFLEADIFTLFDIYSQRIREPLYQLITEMNTSSPVVFQNCGLQSSSYAQKDTPGNSTGNKWPAVASTSTSGVSPGVILTSLQYLRTKVGQSSSESPKKEQLPSLLREYLSCSLAEAGTTTTTVNTINNSTAAKRNMQSNSTTSAKKAATPETIALAARPSTVMESYQVKKRKGEKRGDWRAMEDKHYKLLDNLEDFLDQFRDKETRDEGHCGICYDGGNLILCDGRNCIKGFHLGQNSQKYSEKKQQCCHIPQFKDIPFGNWECFFCLELEKLNDDSFLLEAKEIYFVPGEDGIYSNFQTFLIACKFITDLFRAKTNLVVRWRLEVAFQENFLPTPITLIRIRDRLINLTAVYSHEQRTSHYTSILDLVKDCNLMMKQANRIYGKKTLSRDFQFFKEFSQVYKDVLSKYEDVFPQHFTENRN